MNGPDPEAPPADEASELSRRLVSPGERSDAPTLELDELSTPVERASP